MNDDDLLQLLDAQGGQAAPREDRGREEVVVPDRIPISQGTLDTAHEICDLVRKVSGGAYEWYSLLLAQHGDPDFVARSLLVPDGVDVWPSFVSVNGVDYARAVQEVAQLNAEHGTDYYVIGWLHSHANFSVGFSEEDKKNFHFLLNTVSRNTLRRALDPLHLIQTEVRARIKNNQLVLNGENLEDAVLKYDLLSEQEFQTLLAKHRLDTAAPVPRGARNAFMRDLLLAMGVRAYEPRTVGFGYSIVVNEKRDEPHAVLGVVQESIITQSGLRDTALTTTTAEVCQVDGDWTPSRRELRNIVKNRLRFRRYETQDDGTVFTSRGARYRPQVATVSAAPWKGGWVGQQDRASAIALPKRSGNLTEDEIIRLFVYSAANYLSVFQHEEIKYASYLDELLNTFDLKTPSGGLTSAAKAVGELYTDAEVIHQPRIQPHTLRYLIDKLRTQLPADAAHPERAFVYNAQRLPFGELLETYIPRLRAHVAEPTATASLFFPDDIIDRGSID